MVGIAAKALCDLPVGISQAGQGRLIRLPVRQPVPALLQSFIRGTLPPLAKHMKCAAAGSGQRPCQERLPPAIA